jgi:hypothetical protein
MRFCKILDFRENSKFKFFQFLRNIEKCNFPFFPFLRKFQILQKLKKQKICIFVKSLFFDFCENVKNHDLTKNRILGWFQIH